MMIRQTAIPMNEIAARDKAEINNIQAIIYIIKLQFRHLTLKACL